MFIGHFAAGLAGKRLAPRASLGTYIAAAVLLDLVWPLLVLAGVESFRIVPGLLPMSPFDFTSYPWSHSLVAAGFWAAAFGLLHHARRRDAVTACMLAIVVFSHWVLDWITHRPDLAVAPGLVPRAGLGLWRSVPATMALEGAMFLGAVFWYGAATEPRDRTGRFAFLAYVGVLLVTYVSSLTPPEPGQERLVVAMALAMSAIFIPWAAWLDRHRVYRGYNPRPR